MSSTESIILPDENTIEPDIEPIPKPLVNSFPAFASYFAWFSFLIVIWFVSGVGLYGFLNRNNMLYSVAYVVWAFPLVGLLICVLSGTSTVIWSGTILFWTLIILGIEGVRAVIYGFDPKMLPPEFASQALA